MLRKTRDLQVGDLDLKWTAEAVSGRSGPHVDLGQVTFTPPSLLVAIRLLSRAVACDFQCCRVTTTIDVLIRMFPTFSLSSPFGQGFCGVPRCDRTNEASVGEPELMSKI